MAATVWKEEREAPTEAGDVRGTRVRLIRELLIYDEEFVALDKMVPIPASAHALWGPATNLFEATVARRSGPDLVPKNLPSQTADLLGEAIVDALRRRRT